MSRVYDNWERLFCAVLKRELYRELAYAPSLESDFNSDSSANFSSRLSLDSLIIHGENLDASRISNESIDFATPSHNVREIAFEELKKATKNFRSDLLVGDGRFGRVFKGWINECCMTSEKPGFGTTVAVKRLNPEGFQGEREWMAEINYMGQLRHPNLVTLIGYSSKDDILLLVYEFVAKGSLDNHLFGRRHQSLSWDTRMQVAIGVARVFSFLHGLKPQVIRRGVGASNILLDKDFNAKLSDFSFAKNGPTGDMTHVSTRVMGTYGYVAPEYMATGHLTAKCDVYSFGVVLLELLSGRRVLDLLRVEPNLVEWAKPYLRSKKKFVHIMDAKLGGQYNVSKSYSVAGLALQCLSPEPKLRPMMSEVVVALEQL